MVMAAIAAASLAVGIKSSRTAKKQGKKALKLAEKESDIAVGEYNRYLEHYAGIEEQVADQALAGLPGGYYADRAGAATNLAQQKLTAQQHATLARYGVDPTSSRAQAVMGDLQRTGSLAEAGARTSAKAKVADEEWKRKIQALSVGKGLPASAMSGLGGASDRMMGVADRYSEDARNMATFAYETWKDRDKEGGGDPFGLGLANIFRPQARVGQSAGFGRISDPRNTTGVVPAPISMPAGGRGAPTTWSSLDFSKTLPRH